MIKVSGILSYQEKSELPSQNDAHQRLTQITNDAILGTFGEFPPYWNGKFQKPLREFANYQLVQAGSRQFSFELRLDPDLFAVFPAGFQHLIGVLAGDLLKSDVTITDVELPDHMSREAERRFRSAKAYSISELRQVFRLKEQQPLLAFSFKPRNGLKFDVLKDVTLAVLKAGFNIVELDTRNLNLRPGDLDLLTDLAKRASDVGKGHVTRFSPNLSVPSHLIVEFASRFIDVVDGPAVIKIDGGLDGVSGCQAIRMAFNRNEHEANQAPIITCYPLLRRMLKDKISDNLLIDSLTLSGADIIYIGSRPSLPESPRELDAGGEGGLSSSVIRYHNFVDRNQAMPTVAGGIQLTQLHAFYELLGPNVAYFLGGAIALHRDGPVKGASLAVQVIREAIEIRERNSNQHLYGELSKESILKCEGAYEKRSPYISPKDLFAKHPGLTGWFTRSS